MTAKKDEPPQLKTDRKGGWWLPMDAVAAILVFLALAGFAYVRRWTVRSPATCSRRSGINAASCLDGLVPQATWPRFRVTSFLDRKA